MATSDSKPKQLPLPLEGATVEILLTRNQSVIVDAIDADLACFKWHALYDAKYPGGQFKANREVRIEGRGTSQLMHRVILERMIGRRLARGETVDHINMNTLDNRRSNLRLATMSENSKHRRKRQTNTSGAKGVSYYPQRKKWAAGIMIDGKWKYLGLFETIEAAQKVRQEAARKYYGEFTRDE